MQCLINMHNAFYNREIEVFATFHRSILNPPSTSMQFSPNWCHDVWSPVCPGSLVRSMSWRTNYPIVPQQGCVYPGTLACSSRRRLGGGQLERQAQGEGSSRTRPPRCGYCSTLSACSCQSLHKHQQQPRQQNRIPEGFSSCHLAWEEEARRIIRL